MTTGHKHRFIAAKRGGWIERILRTPLYVTTNLDKVERSRFVYVETQLALGHEHDHCWYLSLLGVLHPLTGLSLVIDQPGQTSTWKQRRHWAKVARQRQRTEQVREKWGEFFEIAMHGKDEG